MKKISAIILAIFMLSLTLCAVPAFAAESFDYVKFTASGNDPYVNYTFDTAIDTSKVTWAVVKYRTVTKTDNTGVDLLGQIYVSPAAEPFVPVKWNHSQSWELIVVDLTSVSASTTLASAWTASAGTGFRFDPIESNRDAEAASDSDTAVVSSGDSIDVAFIAFFETESAAKAFDGTGTGYAALLGPDALGAGAMTRVATEKLTEGGSSGNNPVTGDATLIIAASAVISLGVIITVKKVTA